MYALPHEVLYEDSNDGFYYDIHGKLVPCDPEHPCYYMILGLDVLPCDPGLPRGSSATADQIDSAFRTLAHQLHPSKNPNTEQWCFLCIFKAYKVLSDTRMREAYHSWLRTIGNGDFDEAVSAALKD